MPTDTADPPPAWNATERSRAQTRALLMALSRDRSRQLLPEPLVEVALAAFTLSMVSAWRISRRLLVLERTTWSQLEEFASWHRDFRIGSGESFPLFTWAAYWRTTVASRAASLTAGVAISFGIGLSVYGYLLTRPPHPHITRSAFDPSVGWRILLMMIGAAWTIQTVRLISHSAHLSGWLDGVNNLLTAQRQRPVTLPRFAAGIQIAFILCFGLVCGQLFTNWPIAIIPAAFSLAAASLQLNHEREIHLELIERLLEWMDDTGLPVEYDVTALNPDEIAAMIG